MRIGLCAQVIQLCGLFLDAQLLFCLLEPDVSENMPDHSKKQKRPHTERHLRSQHLSGHIVAQRLVNMEYNPQPAPSVKTERP